jgi:hypothetical protein
MSAELDKEQLARAWNYHQGADQLLHMRIQAMLVAQSFLVGSFVGLRAGRDMAKSSFAPLDALSLGIVAVAVASTLALIRVNRALSNGLRQLKTSYLELDPIYKTYIDVVRAGPFGSARLLSLWLPMTFLIFWLGAAAYLWFVLK